MSTVAVVKKKGYIAIAADTLTKWGSEKNSAKYVVNHNKIITIGENYIAVTGPASAVNVLTHYFNKSKSPVNLRNIDEIFNCWNKLHNELKNNYFLTISDDSDTTFESCGIDVLIANPYGIFGVGAHRDIQEFDNFYSYGSGNEYALGAMFNAFSTKNRSAEDVARIGVEASAEFDDSTGTPIISYSVKLQKKKSSS